MNKAKSKFLKTIGNFVQIEDECEQLEINLSKEEIKNFYMQHAIKQISHKKRRRASITVDPEIYNRIEPYLKETSFSKFIDAVLMDFLEGIEKHK